VRNLSGEADQSRRAKNRNKCRMRARVYVYAFHQLANVLAPDEKALMPQNPDVHTRASKRMLRIQLIDAAHQPPIGVAHRS
jgi:hypothetical protein